jgi:prolyl oligopeptidase
MNQLNYPDARAESAVDTVAGVSFADPYRWLEGTGDDVKHWQRAQGELASRYAREWPGFDRLRRHVARYTTQRRGGIPLWAAGRWFRSETPSGSTQACAIVSSEPFGEGQILWDPQIAYPDNSPFLSWIAPSPDGSILAIGLCWDGSENNRIRLIDVHSGRELPDPPPHMLMDNWTGGVHWLPDCSGFFFSGIQGQATDFAQSVFLHRRYPEPTTEEAAVQWTTTTQYRMVVISRDGRHAVALERVSDPIPVAFARLGERELEWRPFITQLEGTVAGHVLGGKYIAVTDIDAPRGRLVAIPLDSPTPNDPSTWRELVPQSDAVLRSVTPVGDCLYVTEFIDTYSRVRILDGKGQAVGELPLPAKGALNETPSPLANLVPRGHPDQYLFGFSSLTESLGFYAHSPGDAEVTTLRVPEARLDDAIVEDCWAISPDGTRVPYHVVRRRDDPVGPRPTLVYAYGGFNVPLIPEFPGPMAAFVAAGGIFVHAHLRGGGEFGLEWWEGGRFRNKQNVYDDLYAVAEDLIAHGTATPDTLAVTGASNGGLTAAVAITQRPELWAAAIPRVPRLDLIGACRTPYGRLATIQDRTEDIEDPDEIRRIATFSPYQLIRDGIAYPACYIDAGDTDPRCPPQDARKFTARLQKVSSGHAPVLLHVWENVGHGGATPRSVAIEEHTEWLAFALRQLGARDCA